MPVAGVGSLMVGENSAEEDSMRLLALTVFCLVLSSSAYVHAEYRVFHMVITDMTNPTSPKKREFKTNLDPFQWVGYYPLKSTESLDYIDTWRCWDDTGDDEDYCPSPRAKTAAPAANPTETPPAP